MDSPIADFLYPEDAAVFAEATRQLEADDSHTVEVRFRLRVATSSAASDDEGAEELYEVMEGKGMLMMDGQGGGPSHTMWVVRPAPLSGSVDEEEAKDELFGTYGRDSFKRRSNMELSPPFIPVSQATEEPLLCRICDRPTPAWFFEKHNETCSETHRLEHEIVECNDGLREIVRTVDELCAALDRKDATAPPEYRGIALMLPTPTPTPPTALEGLRYSLLPKLPTMTVRKTQHRVLDQVADIVQTALDISIPTAIDDADALPIENQRLLSPNVSRDRVEAVLTLAVGEQARVSDALAAPGRRGAGADAACRGHGGAHPLQAQHSEPSAQHDPLRREGPPGVGSQGVRRARVCAGGLAVRLAHAAASADGDARVDRPAPAHVCDPPAAALDEVPSLRHLHAAALAHVFARGHHRPAQPGFLCKHDPVTPSSDGRALTQQDVLDQGL